MVHFNEATNELAFKIVYYGPAHSGKTQNLHFIHKKLAPFAKSELISLETETARTLYFDLLPVNMGQIQGTGVRLLLYSVPGQIFYQHARTKILQSADAVIFVVDSDKAKLPENRECYRDMVVNMQTNGLKLTDIILFFQYNKRDLPYSLPIEILNAEINHRHAPYHEAVALSGIGVVETLKELSKLLLNKVAKTQTSIFKSPDRHPSSSDRPALSPSS